MRQLGRRQHCRVQPALLLLVRQACLSASSAGSCLQAALSACQSVCPQCGPSSSLSPPWVQGALKQAESQLISSKGDAEDHRSRAAHLQRTVAAQQVGLIVVRCTANTLCGMIACGITSPAGPRGLRMPASLVWAAHSGCSVGGPCCCPLPARCHALSISGVENTAVWWFLSQAIGFAEDFCLSPNCVRGSALPWCWRLCLPPVQMLQPRCPGLESLDSLLPLGCVAPPPCCICCVERPAAALQTHAGALAVQGELQQHFTAASCTCCRPSCSSMSQSPTCMASAC